MPLSVIRGVQNAENVLVRIDPLDLDSLPESVLARTEEAFGKGVTPLQSVHQMLDDVRRDGDSAVLRYAKLLDGSDLEDFRVTDAQMAQARDSVSKELRESLELAAQRVRSFHEATMPSDWIDRKQGLGELIRPLDRVGLYAPGGSAAYPSTVLMTAVPARVAGVREVILCTPPQRGEALNPAVIVAAEIAGVDTLYQVGGVPAIAAMAYGTASVPKVDKICGPGNIFVSYAKKLVQGSVDIDGVFGPTETIVLADKTANAIFCAADLIAQAEHDPESVPILIAMDPALITAVEAELSTQLGDLPTADTARTAISKGGVIACPNVVEAARVSDAIAPEHLQLSMADARDLVPHLNHYGALFIGEKSAEVFGDYGVGPNHVLPTSGTARARGGLSVMDFLRVRTWIRLDQPGPSRELVEDSAWLARQEGLEAHARAAELR